MADSESKPDSSSELTGETSDSAASDKLPPGNGESSSTPGNGDSSVELHSHHISKILDEVLEEPESLPEERRRLKHPMILDVALGVGLLIAAGAFFVGLSKMYFTHLAEQKITDHKYADAITILRGHPLQGFFTIPGSDPDELLNQALYLDALDKMEVDNDVDNALKELQSIQPGSRYFDLSQQIINENFEPSSTSLQGGASVTEEAAPTEEKKPLLPELPKDAVP